MRLLALLLSPFTLIYYALMRFRNHLFDIGYTKSFQFDHPVIAVGNLSVGGTGKSPMIEYMIRLLSGRFKLTTLSRGYGRKSRGFKIATEKDDANTIGDEPFQFYLKYGQSINVAVGEERALAIPEILFKCPDNQLILLDDAFQHRKVVPNLNILLTEYKKPFYHDWVLPSGRLREPRRGAKRADIIVVTKCPEDLAEKDMENMQGKIQRYAKTGIPVFFSAIKYLDPKPVLHDSQFSFSGNVYLFTGIANPQPLVGYIRSKYNLLFHRKFNDHHDYQKKDINGMVAHFKQFGIDDQVILTTEKDRVKLLSESIRHEIRQIPVFYLPIECYFLKNGHIFDGQVQKAVQTDA